METTSQTGHPLPYDLPAGDRAGDPAVCRGGQVRTPRPPCPPQLDAGRAHPARGALQRWFCTLLTRLAAGASTQLRRGAGATGTCAGLCRLGGSGRTPGGRRAAGHRSPGGDVGAGEDQHVWFRPAGCCSKRWCTWVDVERAVGRSLDIDPRWRRTGFDESPSTCPTRASSPRPWRTCAATARPSPSSARTPPAKPARSGGCGWIRTVSDC